MAAKIYTKTGDLGKTTLIGGTKVWKSDTRIECYGTVDELNAHIGLVNDYLTDTLSKETLKEVQDRLFTIGTALACDPEKDILMKTPDLTAEDVVLLEREIDRMTESMPVLKNFILPGGHVAVSVTHIARCVCRRAERLCVRMREAGMEISPLIIIYLNRLSDYLFTLARYIAHMLGIPETPWIARIRG